MPIEIWRIIKKSFHGVLWRKVNILDNSNSVNALPLVSVIVPCYNAEKHISDCLKYICGQSYNNIEIIIVDDGSKDKTCEIIQKVAAYDGRIKIIQQEHQNAGVARNIGIDQSNGKYLMFLDSDDRFLAQMIEKMVDLVEMSRADIGICDAYYYNEKTGEYMHPQSIVNKNVLTVGEIFSINNHKDKIFQLSSPVPWNKIYLRSFIINNRIRFQSLKRSNDEFFVNMALVLASRIAWTKEQFVIYRVGTDYSLQSFSSNEVSRDFYYALTALKSELVQRGIYGEVKESFYRKILSTCMSSLKKQCSFLQYKEMYGFIKDRIKEEFDLVEVISKVPYHSMETLLKSASAEDYLFSMVKKGENFSTRWYFPYNKLSFEDRRIVLYGAGTVGTAYYRQLIGNSFYQLAGWADMKLGGQVRNGWKICTPDKISDISFDKIVIAVENMEIKDEIKQFLICQCGINETKIVI